MIPFPPAPTAVDPMWICEDVRRHILALSRMQHCTRCSAVVSTGRRTDTRGLCAGRSQIREDGGLAYSKDYRLLRSPGISPFWKVAKDRVRQRTAAPDENDWWRRTLWNGDTPNVANQLATLRQTLNTFDGACTKLQKDLVNDKSNEQDR